MSKEELFVNELIGYIFAYPDDDYMTMECLCRKLHKHGLIDKKDGEWTTNFIERKTENCSEKPNNSTRSKMEQVDKDTNVRSKEQQTEEMVSCQTCKHWIPYECTNDKCHYEPKVEELYDQIVEDIDTRVKCAVAKKVEDEPQTDCAWGKGEE